MKKNLYKTGETIYYHDQEENLWGPWEVVAVNGRTLTVRVEGLFDCRIFKDAVRRPEQRPA